MSEEQGVGVTICLLAIFACLCLCVVKLERIAKALDRAYPIAEAK